MSCILICCLGVDALFNFTKKWKRVKIYSETDLNRVINKYVAYNIFNAFIYKHLDFINRLLFFMQSNALKSIFTFFKDANRLFSYDLYS